MDHGQGCSISEQTEDPALELCLRSHKLSIWHCDLWYYADCCNARSLESDPRVQMNAICLVRLQLRALGISEHVPTPGLKAVFVICQSAALFLGFGLSQKHGGLSSGFSRGVFCDVLIG